MAIFREAEIEFKGRKLRFTPSMRLLRRVEEVAAIYPLLASITNGTVSVSTLGDVVALVYDYAGLRQEDVGASTFDEFTDIVFCEVFPNATDGLMAATKILLAMLPQPDEKKPAALPEGE